MRIQIPRKLDFESTLNFCNVIDNIKPDDEYLYDYKNMTTVEPFGMLLLGSKIRKFVNENNQCEHIDCNFERNGYAAHMGFFQSVFLDFGKKPGEAKGNNTYIPITELNFDDIINSGIDIYKQIEAVSNNIANILVREDENLKKCIKFSTQELIRNAFEHSESKSFWYAGQFWPTKRMVEVAILDEGIGMKESITKNKKIVVNNDEGAIKLSMQPGISKCGVGRIVKDEYDNSGFGLYMISSLCKASGDIAVCSGNKCLLIDTENVSRYETSFNGTAIRIRFNSDRLKEVSKLMSELSCRGNQESEEYKKMKVVDVKSIISD